jgi:hypothetical protein
MQAFQQTSRWIYMGIRSLAGSYINCPMLEDSLYLRACLRLYQYMLWGANAAQNSSETDGVTNETVFLGKITTRLVFDVCGMGQNMH